MRSVTRMGTWLVPRCLAAAHKQQLQREMHWIQQVVVPPCRERKTRPRSAPLRSSSITMLRWKVPPAVHAIRAGSATNIISLPTSRPAPRQTVPMASPMNKMMFRRAPKPRLNSRTKTVRLSFTNVPPAVNDTSPLISPATRNDRRLARIT